MLELLDPLIIDPVAYGEGRLKQIKRFSLLPGKRIGWNYCMDYTWLSMRLEKSIKKGTMILDIGCGPGAIHGYLEDKYKIKIIGIDINRWDKDYVDYKGNYFDKSFRERIGIKDNGVDLIISTSAFEHNSPQDHKKLIDVCMRTLRKGGRLVTTFAAAKKTYYYKASNQWNLSKADIEKIYQDRFDSFDFNSVRTRWKQNPEMTTALRKRFGFWGLFFPNFVSVGADIVKK